MHAHAPAADFDSYEKSLYPSLFRIPLARNQARRRGDLRSTHEREKGEVRAGSQMRNTRGEIAARIIRLSMQSLHPTHPSPPPSLAHVTTNFFLGPRPPVESRFFPRPFDRFLFVRQSRVAPEQGKPRPRRARAEAGCKDGDETRKSHGTEQLNHP